MIFWKKNFFIFIKKLKCDMKKIYKTVSGKNKHEQNTLKYVTV